MIFDSSELDTKFFIGGKYKGKTLAYVYARDPNYIYWAMDQAPKLIKSKPITKPKVFKPTVSTNFIDDDSSGHQYNRNTLKPNMNFDSED